MNVSAPLNTLILLGGAMKSAGTVQRGQRNFGKLGGTLCFHSGADHPDQTKERDFFDAKTDFRMQDGLKSPVFYHHGLDKFVGVKELGTAVLVRDAGGVQIDDSESFIDLGDIDGRKTFERAERGELSWSSGTVAHLVRKTPIAAKSGLRSNHIDYWPLGLDASLTPAPAEPRAFATAIKTIIRLSNDMIVDAPEHLADEIAHLRDRLGMMNQDNAQREMQAMQVSLLQSRLIRSQMDVLGHFLPSDGSNGVVSLPTYPAPVSTVDADDAMKKRGFETQPRDDIGRWTSGGGKLSADHVARVMHSEGISDAGHHERIQEKIKNGQLTDRAGVLAHIDAIHGAKPQIEKTRASFVSQYEARGSDEVRGKLKKFIKQNEASAADQQKPEWAEYDRAKAEGARQALAHIDGIERAAAPVVEKPETEKPETEKPETEKPETKVAPASQSEPLHHDVAIAPGSQLDGQTPEPVRPHAVAQANHPQTGRHFQVVAQDGSTVLQKHGDGKYHPATFRGEAPAQAFLARSQSAHDALNLSPKPETGSEATSPDLRAARDKAYAAVNQARGARDRIFAARDAALNGARGRAAMKARGKAAPAGHWITHNGAHVFMPEMGASADHVFAAGVLHGLSEEGHKELQKQYDKGEIETTAHLNMALAEAKRAKRKGFTEVESIREGIAHHGVHGVASHAEKFRAARESERRIMKAHANRDAIVARQDRQEHFWASGMDVVDYVGTHADGFHDAQEMAKDLGYHQSTWDDQHNNKRREKERKVKAKGRRQMQQMADLHSMGGKSAEMSQQLHISDLAELLDELGELNAEIAACACAE